MLAAGTGAQAAFSAVTVGFPVLAPALRDEFGLSLTQVGVLLASVWVGTTLTLLPWGLLSDRIGERPALVAGLAGCAAALAAAGFTESFAALVALLALAGAAGASVNSATGRAVMQWFDFSERGLALGVRQTAIPVGGVAAALALPPLEAAGGLRAAFLFLAGLALVGGLAGALTLRTRAREGVEPEAVPWSIRDARLWVLSLGSGFYLVPQIAVLGFAVLFLHDERGLSNSAAAAALAGVMVVAAALRVAVGRWSDLAGSRIGPLRRIGVAITVALALVAALAEAPVAALVPVLVAAGGIAMAWNGLSLTSAAELAGERRSGAAIGFQQTALAVVGVGAPVLFAALVEAVSWRGAYALAAVFPLAGVAVLRTLRG